MRSIPTKVNVTLVLVSWRWLGSFRLRTTTDLQPREQAVMQRADAHAIWNRPVYAHTIQPPLRDEWVRKAERNIGAALPTTYLALLHVQNGGTIRYSLPENLHGAIWGIGPIWPSIDDPENLEWDPEEDGPNAESYQGLVPFDGDGHWHMCLDYRAGGQEPCVTYLDSECEHEERIADSFSGYLDQLVIDTQNRLVLQATGDLSAVAAQLAEALGGKATGFGGMVQSIRLDRADGTFPAWGFIGTNRVPACSVSPDHERYEELKALFPGDALAYPEVDPDAFLVQQYPETAQPIATACADCGFRVTSLAAALEAGN